MQFYLKPVNLLSWNDLMSVNLCLSLICHTIAFNGKAGFYTVGK